MTSSSNYQLTVTSYTSQLRGLFQPLEQASPTLSITRGGQQLSSEALAERVEQLQATSRRLGDMTSEYLEADDQQLREGAERKLLAQAMAEFEVVQALLEAANSADSGNVTTRSGTQTINVRASVDELARVLELPIGQAVQQPTTRSGPPMRSATRITDFTTTKSQLQEQVHQSVQAICTQAAKVGGRAAQTLVLIDPRALQQGAALISKDLADAVDHLVRGLAAGIKRLVDGALRLLLQAYDWVLALLGKDIEQQARKQVANWLTELKTSTPNEEGEGLVARLVSRIYAPETITTETTELLAATSATPEVLGETVTTVQTLTDTFKAKTDQIDTFLKVIALAKVAPIPWAKTPQFQLILAAIALGLLGYTVYTGYDYLDDGHVHATHRFEFTVPNRVAGIREVVRTALTP